MELAPVLRQRFFDSNGLPLAGGKLYSYAATTVTPLATYSNSTGTANANPVVLDANGEANVWLDPSLSYKFVLKSSADAVQWTIDNVVGILTPDSVVTSAILDGAVTGIKLNANVVDNSTLQLSSNQLKVKDAGITAAKIASGAVSQVKRAALGQQVSSTCGLFTSTSVTYVDVDNLTVTITTTGRPVFVGLMTDGAGGTSSARLEAISSTTVQPVTKLQILRDSTAITTSRVGGGAAVAGSVMVPPSSLWHIDTPAAGTYTYKIQGEVHTGTSFVVAYALLVAYEL